MPQQVHRLQFDSDTGLAEAAARDWVRWVRDASHLASPIAVALSGGRIAKGFFTAIAREAHHGPAIASNVHFFWADERCVPPTDPESNYAMAASLLFHPLGIPGNQVHRIHGELAPAEAAERATRELRNLKHTPEGHLPAFDLVLLGMGEDGHVASLFPGDDSDTRGSTLVYRNVVASKPPPNRITLTYPMLASAREVWVLASGKGKEGALASSLRGTETPLGRVRANRPSLTLYTDIRGEE
jgi:6-phosphogluconolactonase